MKKNYILKKAAKGGLILDILFPVIIGYLFYQMAEVFRTIGADTDDPDSGLDPA